MLGNLSKRSHNLLIHLRIVINYFLVRGVEPMGLHCPHSDLHILYIKPMLGKFKGRIRTYYPATAAAECSQYNTLS